MDDKRQKTQLELAFTDKERSEAPKPNSEGTEPSIAECEVESPAMCEMMMEAVCQPDNLRRALRRVVSNKGSPGIDGITVKKLPDYLLQYWPAIREQLLSGTYEPQPVLRVEIPKPDGGVRKLGIPCALDRFIQQAVLQVLQEQWDPTFSAQSFGFRPKRTAHQAVACSQQFIAEGYRWVVDIDLEKFFDRVNHDRLMSRVANRVSDKRLLRLLRTFLNAGVMENGVVSPTKEGAPQGGPLSPLLSNLVLDELDRELERRGHRFVRYADDCNIYVRTRRAGQRVMDSLTAFITHKLKLKVNTSKSAVARPWKRKFLGFSFTHHYQPKRRIAPKAVERFKERIRELTSRTRGVSLRQMIAELAVYLRGWEGYFGHCQTPSVLRDLDRWIRRRLRAVAWKHWRSGNRRYRELHSRGTPRQWAAKAACSRYGPWRMSRAPAVIQALTDAYFVKLGLPSLQCFTTA